MSAILRPRLADHVAARRHHVGSDVVVALHDERTDRVATIGEREWTLLAMADGTRDVEGILAAARRAGRHARREHLAAFLDQLDAAGMLAEGPSLPPGREEAPSDEAATSDGASGPEGRLGVRAMPGFSLRCDGAGTCCRLYPTTVFTPREARAALHFDPEGPDETERFTPEQGSERLPWRGRAVAMVDGRCSFLASDGRCGLHAAGGASAKPLGCRRYPVRLVRDHRELRVAVAPECACVFQSVLAPAQPPEPLVDPWPRHGHDLNDVDFVEEVPTEVTIRPGERLACASFVSWCDDATRRFADAPDATDAARWLWAEAASLEAMSGEETSEPNRDQVAIRLATLVEQLARRRPLATWRSPDDLARVLPESLQAALDVPVATLIAPRPGTPHERFFVRALLFGHDPALSAPTVSEALRRRAMQLWAARQLFEALPERVRQHDPAARHPLALVAAYARAFGL